MKPPTNPGRFNDYSYYFGGAADISSYTWSSDSFSQGVDFTYNNSGYDYFNYDSTGVNGTITSSYDYSSYSGPSYDYSSYAYDYTSYQSPADTFTNYTYDYSSYDYSSLDYGSIDYTGMDGFGYPIVLDLAGTGLKVTSLDRSNMFFDMAGDGYQHHTAWAGTGNGVLVLDLAGTGQITQRNQVVFTDWDPTAANDMEALAHVFDTNRNGKIDAGDAKFTAFKVLVTNADGTTTLKTLAEAGVASIDLKPNAARTVLPDGSVVQGETTFTRTNGTTGTAGAVSFGYEADGYVVKRTVTSNADGSTTIDNKAYNANGSLASQLITTTSADGKTRTTSSDNDGDGVIDLVQTIATVVAITGITTETLTNKNGGGVLLDKTVTTTSADGKTITIARDNNGDGLTDQNEVRVKNADGSSSITVSNLAPNGTLISKTVSTVSANGLTRTVTMDKDGNTTVDVTETDATVVALDGSRTQTVSDTNNNGSLKSRTITVTSADGRTKTATVDSNGDGVFDLKTVSQIVVNADGSSTSTVTDTNNNATLRGKSVTATSADGLTITTQTDRDANGTFDFTKTDATVVNADGSRTETVTVVSASGALISKSVIVRGADGQSRTIQLDSNGDTKNDKTETIALNTSGASVDTVMLLNADGTLHGKSVTTTSADGLTVTKETDLTGDGVTDTKTVETTVKAADGSSTTTLTVYAANGTVVSKSITVTSANGLSSTTTTDVDGNGTVDRTTSDVTVVNADGSRVETITVTSNTGILLSKTTTTTSADRKTITVVSDLNGDGKTDKTETIVVQANGSIVTTVTLTNPDGTLKGKSITTTSANGLTQSVQSDLDGNGTIDETSSSVTVINADGSRTTTRSVLNASGTLIAKTVTTTSATGLSTTITSDINGDGVVDGKTTDVTVLKTDGSRTETVSALAANNALISKVITTVNATGLTTTVQRDLNGDGVIDRTTTDTTVLNANGSSTETVTETNTNGSLRYKSVVTTLADGRSWNSQIDTNGDAKNDGTESVVVATNGDVVDTLMGLNPDGTLRGKVVTTSSATGLSRTVQTDVNVDGIFDLTQTEVTAINANGSSIETVTSKAGTTLIGKTVTTTSANGLSITSTNDADGNGTTDVTTTDATTLNANGSTTRTQTRTNGNASLRDKTVTTISADGKSTTILSDINGDAKNDTSETIVVQTNGSTVNTVSQLNTLGAVTGRVVLTTAANGLSWDRTQDDNNDGLIDQWTSHSIAINADGSRTETFEDDNGALHATSDGYSAYAWVETTTSADGLTRNITVYGDNEDVWLDSKATDKTVINADGSRTQTVTVVDYYDPTIIFDKKVVTTSANGLSQTIQLDDDGSGTFEVIDTKVVAVDGSSTKTLTRYNQNGVLAEKDTTTVSFDGRSKSVQSDLNGDGVNDRYLTSVYNVNGSTTVTTWDAKADGTLRAKVTATTGATGLSRSITTDGNGDNVIDGTVSMALALNADGSRTLTGTESFANGKVRDKVVTTTSANGLVVTTQVDLNGDGTFDETLSDVTTVNADGSRSETTSTTYANGTLKSRMTVTTSANGRSVSTSWDNNGDGAVDVTDLISIASSGDKTETTSYLGSGGTLKAKVTATTSADERIVRVLRDTNGDGSTDLTETMLAVADGYGSYCWTQQDSAGYVLLEGNHTIGENNVDEINLWIGSTHYLVIMDLALEKQEMTVVERLYDTILDRGMSAAERETWVQYYSATGMNRTQLALDLMNSNEFKQRFGTLTNAEFVAQIYQNALDRGPSMAEMGTLLTQLGNGTLTRAGLVMAISEGVEHIEVGNGHLVTNNTVNTASTFALDHTVDTAQATAIVSNLYATTLGRAVDATGLGTYTQRLLSGTQSMTQIANDLVISAEFATKYGTLTNAAFVTQLFTNALGRAPQAAEASVWTQALTAGTATRADLVTVLSQSTDHLAYAAQTMAGGSTASAQQLISAMAGFSPTGAAQLIVSATGANVQTAQLAVSGQHLRPAA